MLAKLRVIQQSYAFHAAVAIVVAIIGGVAKCYGDPNPSALGCWQVGIVAGVGAFFLSIQHSPNSASFHADGRPNTTVADVVTVQKAAGTIPEATAAAGRIALTASMAAHEVTAQS